MYRRLLFLFFPAILSGNATGQIVAVAGANGTWNSPSSWVGGVIPASTDSVIIPAGTAILIINSPASALSLTVHGLLEITSNAGSTLHLIHSFVNTGTTTNDEHIKIDRDFTNSGSVFGTGTICVSDSTRNTGTMYGSFDFCDLTPPSNPPFIDDNSGTFSTGISFCITGPCAPAGLHETGDENNYTVSYTNAKLQVTLPLNFTDGKLFLYSALGYVVFSCPTGNQKTLSLSREISSGIYFVVLVNDQKRFIKKVLVH